MKKLILLSLPVIVLGLGFAIANNPIPVYAEEEPITSEPVVDTSEPEPVESEPELTEEEQSALDEVKGWLNQHLDKQMVANIITWVSEAGVLTGLLGVYIKYRKFKYKTLEDLVNLVKSEVGKYLTENFEKLSENQIKGIVESVDNLEKSNETIMKVLVLMQDSTKAGKVALLDFLGSKTENKEIKEMAENAGVELEEEVKAAEEIKEKVNKDYEKIF